MNRVQATALVREMFELDGEDTRIVGRLAGSAPGMRCDHCLRPADVEIDSLTETGRSAERDNTICCHDCATDHIDALTYVPGVAEIVVTLHPGYITAAAQAA